MDKHSGQVIEAQADYLTCSAHGEDASDRLEALGFQLLAGEREKGNELSPWRTMGYEGTHAGQVDVGRRDRHQSILRLSGQMAEAELVKALSCADHVTRLDLCVTWRAEPPDPHLGQNAYSLADLHFRAHPRGALPSFQGDALGGYSCYLGDRRSPYFARIYNKEAERLSRADGPTAAHYAGCWRYEVESHDHNASLLAPSVIDASDRAAWVQQWVFEWFEKRGVPPAFPPSGAAALVPGFHRRTDDETSLRHLEKSVRPTIRRLREHGQLPAVLKALGLEDSNQTPT